MARPLTRTVKRQIRFTPEEEDEISERAETAGLTFSEHMRLAALGKRPEDKERGKREKMTKRRVRALQAQGMSAEKARQIAKREAGDG